MTTDARGHTIPALTDAPDLYEIPRLLSLSINDPIEVANTTARAAKLVELAGLTPAIVPSTSNPITFFRADAGAGLEVEYTTDGTIFHTHPSVAALQARRARGVQSISGTSVASGNYASAAISFGKTLPGTADGIDVTLTMLNGPSGSGFVVLRALSVTTTGFTLAAYNLFGSTVSWTGLQVGWAAEVAL